MKVLIIGQLPLELGGNYTTGIARVIGELSRCKFKEHDIYLYGTNIPDKKAKKGSTSDTHFLGYKKRPFRMLLRILCNPIETLKQWRNYRYKYGLNPLRMEFYKDNFFRIINDVNPDLIHHHGAGIEALYNAKKNMNIPVLFTLHGLMWDGSDNSDVSNMSFKKHESYAVLRADYYTTLNVRVLNKMKALGVDANRITIIPNGVDSSKFYYSEYYRKILRDRYSVSENTKVFITTGVVINRKGQLSFLKILESLDIDYQYWIIGKGPDYDSILEYVTKHNIGNKVKLLGYIKDTEIFKYHSAADIYAHASIIEGQALSEIEAYTTGLRVIVRKEIFDTVIGDPLIDDITYFIADFDKIDKESVVKWVQRENVNRATRAKYDWSIIANKYACLYDEINKLSK